MPAADRKKRFLALALFAITVPGAFYWGFQSHRNHWFPYMLLRGAFHFARAGGDMKQFEPVRQKRASVISLPYVSGTHDPNIDQSGVLAWNRTRAWTGLNLFAANEQQEIQLLDMAGRVIHRWPFPEDESRDLALAVALPDGSVFGLVDDVSLFKLDRDGRELWRFAEPAHHSIELDRQGNIWTLTRKRQAPAGPDEKHGTIEDFIVQLSPDGRALQRISIPEILRRSPFSGLVPTFLSRGANEGTEDETLYLDYIHANHVEAFDGTLARLSPMFAEGNLLVSLRNMNAIAIIDGRTQDILWLWGPGYLFAQHHSTLLENGNILVFNNGVERSSIVEIDPRSNRIAWEYAPDSGFFSRQMGSCQRLPNGNTLITDSESGRVFEVTGAGEIVWQFANPDRSLFLDRDRDYEMRRLIYRLDRYPPGYFEVLERQR